MQRMFATTFAIALLGVGACKAQGGDAAKLVPNSATLMGAIDLVALQKSELWADGKKYLEEGEAKENLEAAKACNLGVEKWKSVTFGMDYGALGQGGDAPSSVIVISAEGVGKKENIECVAGKFKEKVGKDPWTIEEKGGRLVLDIDEGKQVGYAIDDNTMAVVGKAWANDLEALIQGKGQPAVDHGLKDAVATANKSKAIWFAGNLPPEVVAGSPAEGAKTVAGSIDLQSGIGLAVSIAFGSAEDATAKAAELQTQFDQLKGVAGAMGVPQTVTDSVKIAAQGIGVDVSANISSEDLKTLQDTAAKAGM